MVKAGETWWALAVMLLAVFRSLLSQHPPSGSVLTA
jgi:hypothetical protein